MPRSSRRGRQPGATSSDSFMITAMKPNLLAAAAIAAAVLTTASAQSKKPATTTAPAPRSFTVVEATIPEMRAAMEQGRITSRELVRQYLARIATYEDRLHAAITVNPRALEEADARDRERTQGRVKGPLHGIPV